MGSYVNWPLAEIMQQALQAYQAGQSHRQRRDLLDQQNEDRALARQHLKLEMDKLKLEEAWQEKQHQMTEANFLQGIATPQFGVQNQMQAPGPETSMRSQGDQGPGPSFSPETIGQGQVTPPHVVGGPMGDMAVPGLQDTLRQALMAKLQEGLMGAQVAGVKAGAEAKATQPYAMERQAAGQQFTAGENALNRANTLNAARIRASEADVNRETSRVDNSYKFESTKLEATRKPLVEQAERFSRLVETVNQKSPQADALIAPELLTVMAGGTGSGLRMSRAELENVTGGRSNLESLKAALNKWKLDPTKALSVTDAQRGQIQTLISAMRDRINSKTELIDNAAQGLVDAKSVNEHRRILADLKKKLTTVGGTGFQVGDKKTFPNGKVGTWDGNGWVAQ